MILWVLVGLPLLAGAGLLLAGRRADPLAAGVAIAVAAAALLLAGLAGGTRPAVQAPLFAGIPAALAVDGLSAVLLLTVTAVTLAVLVFAAGEFGADEARARFFGLMLLFAGAMLVTVTATGLAVLLMAWEVMGATSYGLIGFWWRDPARTAAGTVAFLTTRTADLGMYLAAGAALAGGDTTLRLAGLPGLPAGWRDVATVGLVLAGLGKSAQLPFSFWLSRAMAGPSPVSALLHSATMVAAGAYLLLRLQPLLAATGWAGPLVAWVGAVTALVLGAVAVFQRDLKQLLAASTCSQLGFMVLGAGAGGVAGGTAQLVAHAATKSLLFLAAGAWLSALGTKDLAALAGAGRRFPVVGRAFAVGALTLAGVPPLSLWVAKDGVLAAALARSPALYAVGLAAAAVSAAYAGRALVAIWAPAPAPPAGWDSERPGTRRVTGRMAAPLPALAAAAVALGLLVVPAGWGAFSRLLGGPAGPEPAAWQAALSAVVALGALAGTVGWYRVRGTHRWPGRQEAGPATIRRDGSPTAAVAGPLAGWLGLEPAVDRLVVRPTLRLAALAARADDRWVDGGVRAAAALATAAARLAGGQGERSVDGAVRAVATGGRRLGGLARRPQTGQLHHYYAQAVVALAALAVLLLVVR